MEFIDLQAQRRRIAADVSRRMENVLRHGRFIMGPEVGEVESELAGYTGARHCLTTSSGTDSLLIALMALGVGRGDEVVTSSFSFIAAAEVIALLGATPVLADISPSDFNIDPTRIEACISPRTKAIIPVDLYGQSADYDAINALARKHRLTVIADAAQSFGATYHGRRVGTLAGITITSFFPSKPLGCYGDGGAIFTDDENLAESMNTIRLHGQESRYRHTCVGVNGRIDTLQAAVLLSKLAIFPDEVEARQEVARRYADGLGANLAPHVHAHNTSVFAQYTIRMKNRDAAKSKLQSAGIPTAVHYPLPINLQPGYAFLGKSAGSFPVAEAAAEEVMSLPFHPYLEQADQDRIVEAVLSAAHVAV